MPTAREAIAQLEQERILREQEQQRYQALIEKLRKRGTTQNNCN
ncbi:hypothetical protein [Microseira sp. BLCC-F43]|jgi:hypothetical protein